MGWFWADSKTATAEATPFASSSSKSTELAKCPIDHSKFATKACPVLNKDEPELNPLNNMPYALSSEKAEGQTIDLPTEKTLSTIPRGDTKDQGVWEYPSPQQMFNAMIRKGKGDVPEDAVESMVSIHNFLNEGAWEEILAWEKPHTDATQNDPRLLKFTGRPHDITPRAFVFHQLSKIFPDSFNTELPFDRHDWTVLRSDGADGWKEVRYVIDYYGGPEDEHGMPTFFLDVRPALDNATSAKDLFSHWVNETKPAWDKALGREGK